MDMICKVRNEYVTIRFTLTKLPLQAICPTHEARHCVSPLREKLLQVWLAADAGSQHSCLHTNFF